MLSPKKLTLVIQEDLAMCRKAGRILTDTQVLEAEKLEVATLLRHLQMTEEAGEDQIELERVVKSLEANPLVANHQDWREKATVLIPASWR